MKGLCTVVNAPLDDLGRFQTSLGITGPSFVEYQYLMKGFGYSVYKEGTDGQWPYVLLNVTLGFDVVFHYFVGYDRGE